MIFKRFSLDFFEPPVGIEPTSTDYKSVIITFILRRHLEQRRRIELPSLAWQASVLIIILSLQKNLAFIILLVLKARKNIAPELYDSWTRVYTIYILCIRLTLRSLKCCTKSVNEMKRTQVKPDSYDAKCSADI